MKKPLLLTACILLTTIIFAQDTTNRKARIDLSNRAKDHLLLQFGLTGWAGKPDSIQTGGFSRSINVYFMFDFPFKTNPKLSMAAGLGVGTDNMMFRQTYVGIKDLTPSIRFIDQADTNHFKKTKLVTAYLEAPVEFRYSANPATGNGFKMAFGIKVGTMLSAHTRNDHFRDSSNNTINNYVMKEASKRFFNKNRLVGTARFGYGHFTVFGTYQITQLFRDGQGPVVRPFTVGLTLSGL
ncbi:MAG TPA: outer membrane beta-barrel protein [Chitinophagaceae bacterium]|nr:outer membrane beta-barrel protein [Chitinophagaceae bacterium]